MNGKLYTVIAIRHASALEQEKGTGDIILAGPTTLTAANMVTACVQFGAANAAALKDAPAGLLEVTVKEGL